MADVQVDELSIKLSSTLDAKLATNLKAITDGLTKLHNSLTAFSASSSAIKSVDLMVTEFNKLGASVDKINVDKINSLSGALGRLSGAGEKINKTFGGLSFSGAEKSLDRYRKKAESIGDSFAKSLGIEDTEGIDKAKQAVNELSEAIYKWKTAGAERPDTSGLVDVAKDYANALQYVSVDADKATSSVLEFIRAVNGSGNKILLPTEARGDRYYAQKRRTLGPAFTTDQSKGGTSLAHFISDYNSASGNFIDPSLNEAEMFEELYKQVASARTELDSYNQAALRTSEAQQAITEEVRSTANDLAKLASQTANFNSMLNEMGVGGSSATAFTNLKDSLTGLSQVPNLPDLSALGNLSKSVRTFANENIQTAMANLPSVALGLKTGLDALQGVTVPDLTGISQISKAVKTFANPDINTAVANMPGVITGISELAHGLAGITVPDLDGISSLIKVIGGLGGKGISNAISNLPQLGNATTQFANEMANLPSIPPTVISDIGSLQENLKKYSNKSVQNALPVLPQMGAAVKQLINDIATTPPIDPSIAQTIQGLGNLNAQAIKGVIELSKESEKASKKVNLLGSAFKGVTSAGKGFVGAIKNGISWLKNLKSQADGVSGSGFANLTKSIVMVRTALWGAKRVISGFAESVNLASDLTEVNNVIDNVYGDYAARIEDISHKSIENYGISELTFKKYAGQFQAMASTMGITDEMVSKATDSMVKMGKAVDDNGNFAYESTGKMQDLATSMAEWTADLGSLYNYDYDVVAEKVASIFTGTAKPMRVFGVDLTQTNVKAWALANGLNADMESMTQAEKATLRYQYALSATEAAIGDFRRTFYSFANQTRVLKENFNALKTIIGTGLIAAIKPFVIAMNNAFSGVLAFAQNVLNALGKIFGWEVEIGNGGLAMDDTVSDLADGLSDVGDAGNDAATGTGNAAKALEEYKKQVLSFDELHMLSAPTENNPSGSGGSGGGGGSGSGGVGAGGMTSAGDVDVTWKRTKALYESEIDTLEELGEYIASTLKKSLDSIDWNSVYEKARGFGTGFAEFINGLFNDPLVFQSIGKTIANSINTALEAKGGFLENLDFNDIGMGIAAGINSTLRGLNWTRALKNAKKWGEGVGTALNTFLKVTDFDLIGKSVGGFINTRIQKTLSLTETFNFKGLGKKIADAANGFIKVANFKGFGETVSNVIIGVVEAAGEAITSTDFKKLGEGVRDALAKFNWPKFTKAGAKLIGGLLKAAVDSIAGLFGDFAKNIGDAFVKGFNDHVKTMTDAGVPLGQAVMDGVGAGIANVLGKGATWFVNNIVTPFVEGFKEAFGIHSPADNPALIEAAGWVGEGILNGIADKFKNVTGWVKENILAPITNALGSSEAVKTIHMGIGLVKDGWNGFTSWLLGDNNGSDESGEVETTNKVENVGTKVRKFLTGNDEGTTTTKNTANQTRGSWYEKGKGFLGWLTGGTKKGVTSTTNKAKVEKSGAVSKFSSFLSWLTGGDKNGNTTANTTAKVNPYYGGYGSLKQQLTQSTDGSISITIKASVTGVGSTMADVLVKLLNKATGGIFYGGSWHNIASYAGGVNSAPTGQLFIAREAGPELVGSIGNHTAVVNNDQIVSSVANGVYTAVRSAMASVNTGSNQAPIIEVVVKADNEVLYRQVKRGEKSYNGRYSTVATVS